MKYRNILCSALFFLLVRGCQFHVFMEHKKCNYPQRLVFLQVIGYLRGKKYSYTYILQFALYVHYSQSQHRFRNDLRLFFVAFFRWDMFLYAASNFTTQRSFLSALISKLSFFICSAFCCYWLIGRKTDQPRFGII